MKLSGTVVVQTVQFALRLIPPVSRFVGSSRGMSWLPPVFALEGRFALLTVQAVMNG